MKDDVSKVSPKLLYQSLLSTVCPSCGKYKASRMSLCRPCFGQLDIVSQRSLYRLIGQGYAEAFAGAMHKLIVCPIHFPTVERYEMLRVQRLPDNQANRDMLCDLAVNTVRHAFPGIIVDIDPVTATPL